MKYCRVKRGMKQVNFYLLVLCCVLTFQNIIGQASYVFHNLKTNDGLSHNNVKAILRDSYGFLWVGTESGLNRYDGYSFKIYTKQSKVTNSLSFNDIYGLKEDGLGNIWVDLGYSYMIYKRDKDCFVTVNELLYNLHIKYETNSKVYIDLNRNIWVFDKKKAFYYNIKNKKTTIFKFKKPVKEFSSSQITDSNGFLYFIQDSKLCLKLDMKSGYISQLKLPFFANQSTSNASNYVKIFADSNSWLWFSSSLTGEVFYNKDIKQGWKKVALSSGLKTETNKVTSFVEKQPGQIWIGTDHKGLFIYDKAKDILKNVIYNPSVMTGLATNNIECLYKDNNETIWIGHSKKGLSYYHESFRNFINFKSTEFKDISTAIQDYQGNIWLGTDGDGIYIRDKKSQSIKKLAIPNIAIVCFLEDKKKRIWIGTYQKGLYCYENGKFTQYTTKNSKLTSNNVWSLMEDRFGNIWIGALGGKIQFLEADSQNFDALITPFEEVFYVLNMHYDGGDKMYVGTVYGLLVIDITNDKKILYQGNKKGNQLFSQNLVSSVFKDTRGLVWVGNNDGLTIWDQKKDTLYYFNKEKGLCDNSIRGITEDNLNNIWVTTSNGLSIVNVKVTDNDLFNFSSKNYTIKDGLMDNYFNNHAICKLQNGDILLGNADGYTILNPNKMFEKDQPIASVIFTNLRIGNNNILVDSSYNGRKLLKHPMQLTSELKFKHDDKLISLHFTTVDLLNADRVKYLYKIEGFNSQWMPTQGNKIEISSLPSGSYKLLIKACNSDGVWNENPTELDITIMPPFYLSIWAYIIYILGIIGALKYISYKTRERQILKLEQHRIQMDHDKKMHINEIKLRFFTNISHDLRTPLTLIITPLQILLKDAPNETMRKKLSVMYKNAQQLLGLINSLLDFHKLDVGVERLNLKSGDYVIFINEIYNSFCVYADERKINFIWKSDIEILDMQFDHDKIRKILTNILSNAFKYTLDGGTISVHVKSTEDYVVVSVSDSGSGISNSEKEHIFERFYQSQQEQEKTGSGIGLHIVYEYVNLHGGSINVSDNVPYGSIFTFKIPFKTVEVLSNENILPENLLNEFDLKDVENVGLVADKKVLLFVDDNNDFCEFIKDNLEDLYTVKTANNGEEALEILQKFNVTIVVSDVMMPVMNGIELCKRIKTSIQWSHIPVILLTARTAEEYIMEGLELGADDYITKPFNFDILKLRIQKFVEWTQKNHVTFSQKLDVSPAEITITSLDEALIEKAIKVVEESISDPDFSVESLSMALGLSRGHLYKKLIAITGKGPTEFIRTIRLKRGRQLLEKSQLQISEIAYEVGFNSPKRFAKYFREEFGLSPSEYLRIYKQQ